MNNERYERLLNKVNGLANGEHTDNVYHLFLQKLFKAGFVPFVDKDDNLTDKQRGYIPYGAVAFTAHNDNVYATYASLHVNTVTDVPDKVYITEYVIYTSGERSRIVSHTYADPYLLDKTANDLLRSKTMQCIGFEAKYNGMEFLAYSRPCKAIFIDKNKNIVSRSFMDCNLIHPIIKVKKPVGE